MKFFAFLRQSCLIVFLFGGLINAVTADVDVYFIPDDVDRFSRNLMQSLDAANEKVLVASYWITSQPIINQLINLKRHNIDVQIIYDSSTPNNLELLRTLI